jgi:hypothetical protein
MQVRLFKRGPWRFAVPVIGIAVVGALGVAWSQSDPLRSTARRQWKDRAIAQIERRLNDKPWLDAEVSRLRSAAATQPHRGVWVGDELLVTKNGDWIICQNVCTKEQDTPVKRDIFIGRGSDGRWYYSTFHFCVGKCVLQIMGWKPDSLAQFVDAYWLVPFDPKSDECLKITWEGGPFGQEKLESAHN